MSQGSHVSNFKALGAPQKNGKRSQQHTTHYNYNNNTQHTDGRDCNTRKCINAFRVKSGFLSHPIEYIT